MKNPFLTKMPLILRIKIRRHILHAWIRSHKKACASLLTATLIPIAVVFMFFVIPQEGSEIGIDALVAEARAAQHEEVARGSKAIYHTKQRITEGSDKAAFVASVLNGETEGVEARTDIIETWHHNETALALIESNGTDKSFEAYLSLEHDGEVQLHHYGLKDTLQPKSRQLYDQAHDLASLYTEFTSPERPDIPVMPDTAEYLAYNENAGVITFIRKLPSEGLEVEYDLNTENFQIDEERIYVVTDDSRFEMTRVTFLERSIIEATEFESIFDPSQYDYQVIRT